MNGGQKLLPDCLIRCDMEKRVEGNEFDVIVIGGGATGAGTARDCAMRGLRVLLLERFDYTNGATGRNHGLLHSGARYAVGDGESAAECIRENRVLRRIARHCVEENDGLFVSLPEDDIAYQAVFVERCRRAGIAAEAIDPKEAIRLEPAVNPSLIGAVRVPDGSVDPFRLTMANILDARAHGAVTKVFHEVVGLLREQDRIVGVEAYDHMGKSRCRYRASVVVNAAGIWGHRIAALAGITVNMYPAKGALLVFGHRVNNMVLNRCRKAADADILVPGDTVTVIGTTSTRVPYEEVDRMRVTPGEVDLLLSEGMKLAPALADTRILRAYAGVRPLVADDSDPTGRNISRGIVLLDHAVRDGLEGFLTITGGKLITYRLMAEWATDAVCRKLGVVAACRTAEEPLPGSRGERDEAGAKAGGNVCRAAAGRHGELVGAMALAERKDRGLVCECEGVSVGEVDYAIRELDVTDLSALRRRTRVGMGTCQGGLCACRAAGMLAEARDCTARAKRELVDFLNERWRGMLPVAWGECLRESQFSAWIYGGVCGLESKKEEVLR